MTKAKKEEPKAKRIDKAAEKKTPKTPPPKAKAAKKKAPAAKPSSSGGVAETVAAKSAASGKPTAKVAEKKARPVKKATATKASAPDKKTSGKSVVPVPEPGGAEKNDSRKTSVVIDQADLRPATPPPAPVQVVAPFNVIKVSSGKPSLSVAPGFKFLNRQVPVKSEPAPHHPDRRLSAQELGGIKTDLTERRERLLTGIHRELSMQKERAESKAADDVDKATDAYDEDLSFEIATATGQQLEEIQTALEKIEKGTYGECEICGCVIAPARLKTLPFATTCRACQMQEEEVRRRDDGAPSFSIIGGDEGGEGDAEPL